VTEAVPSAMATVPAMPQPNTPICAVRISRKIAPVQGRIATAPISARSSRVAEVAMGAWGDVVGGVGPWA
jgi:hypothetical protein